MEKVNIFFKFVLPIAIVIMGLILSIKSDILKDESYGETKPYSLARTQLMWWTLIILSCFTSYYGDNGVLQNLDESALILLGISIGTASAARMIDNSEISNEMTRHQAKEDTKKGFLINILSDNNGISIHRFQAFVFNLIFGFIFIAEFLKEENSFVDFGPMELGLMGISSAAYVGLKFSENKASSVQNKKINSGIVSQGAVDQANFSEEELIDIDESYAIDRSDKNVWG